MRVEGSYDFDAPRQDVWDALRSPEFLSSCFPGAHEVRTNGRDSYDLTVSVHVAGFTGNASAKIAMADVRLRLVLFNSFFPIPRHVSENNVATTIEKQSHKAPSQIALQDRNSQNLRTVVENQTPPSVSLE